jgi:hypothetical protein
MKKNKIKWTKNEDLASINYHIEWISDETFKARIKDHLIWAITKAWKYLYLSNTAKVSSIMLNASIPIFVAISGKHPDLDIAVIVVSSLLLIITSSSVNLKFQELWKQFRITSEEYKAECITAYMSVGQFENLTLSEREKLLCINLNQFFYTSLNAWNETYKENPLKNLK